MFDITKLILKIPNALSSKECDNLRNEFDSREYEHGYESCPHARTGIDTTSTFKAVTLQPNTSNFNLIKTKTKQVVQNYLNYVDSSGYFHTLMKNGWGYSHLYRLLKYETGTKIHPHTDHGPYVYGSVSFTLNDDFEGGNFSFFNNNYTVELKKGDAIIWPADYFWVHEVTPITSGSRYSTNGFIVRYPTPVINETERFCKSIYEEYMSSTSPDSLLGPYND